VNTDPAKPIPMYISLTGVQVAKQAQIETINGSALTTANDFTHPEAVHITSKTTAAGQPFSITLPEHSVSVITLDIEQR
jgi:alpha-L-arabinofuranosidase